MALFTRQEAPAIPPLTPEYLSFDLAPKLLAVSGTLTALAFVVFAARTYVRAVMLKVFGVDDYLMLVAVILNITVFSFFVKGTRHGLGKHIYAISPEDFAIVFNSIFWEAFLVVIAVSFVKLSIAFFLLRLAQRTRYKRLLYGIIVFLIVMTIVSVAPVLFRCVPVAASWDISLQGPPFGTKTPKCLPFNAFIKFGVFNSSMNIATDVLFAVLPIPMIWNLQINTRTKISLGGILSLGLFACAAAIYKTPMQYHFAEDTDSTAHGAWYWVWQMIELTLGIIAASLPSLKPLFNWCLETAKSLTTRHSPRSGVQSTYNKRNSSLAYIKTVTSKFKNDDDGDRIELRSMGESETTETPDDTTTTTDKPKGMYSVKITGKGWNSEKSGNSEEAILPIESGQLDINGIRVTTKVSMS